MPELDFDVVDSSNVTPLPSSSALQWEVFPEDGRRSWDVDIRPYANGNPEKGIRAREQLAAQLAPAIRGHSYGRPLSFRAKITGGLTKFWRFLDSLEEVGAGEISDVRHITHAHGQLFKTWLLRTWRTGANRSRQEIGTVRYWLEQARDILGVADPMLLWPSIQMPRGTQHKDVDPRLLRPLYHHLKRYHLGFLAAAEEGRALLARGCDPRSIGDGECRAAWSEPANYAFLAAKWVEASLADHSVTMEKFGGKRFNNPKNYYLTPCGPAYLQEETRTASDAIRWFVPMVEDATAAYLLVMLHTGWNPETVYNIDVSQLSAWADERLDATKDPNSKTATVAIYAHKGKSDREQIAFSLRRPQGHPFQIIKAMIERTRPLRESLQIRLDALEAITSPSKEQARATSELRFMVRSPWLYFRMRGVSSTPGRVGVLGHTTAMVFRSFCRDTFEGIRARIPADERQAFRQSLEQLTLSDLRDGFASFIYDNSLFNVILLKQALGHGNIRTTRAYLRQRRQIAQRFGQFTTFQEALFDEIKRFRAVDPTVLYIRLSVSEITDEQRRRLADRRLRTRMGMGCLDPASPPPDVAPGHRGGLCAVQRCTLCVHGVVFEDTLPHLAVRQAELRHIRSRVAAERFQASSFQFEWLAILTIVENVYSHRRDEFDRSVNTHIKKLEAGEAYLFDQVSPALVLEDGA
jgi:hypothetical protein